MLSKSIRPLHNPAINPDMYSRSTPTGIAAQAAASAAHPPPAIVQAAKNNAYYIGRLQQHLDDFDKDLTEWHDSGVWKQDYKTWGAACELALDMTRQAAHKAISRYKAKASAVSGQASTTVDVSTDSKDAKLLEKFSTREDPEAPLPGVVDANAPLENGETMEDYEDRPKARTRTASTKADTESATDKPPVDTTGHPIPQSILKLWTRRQEVQDLMTAVSELRTKIRDLSGQNTKANGHSDPLYAGMGWQHPMENLNALYYQLTECKPDVVCPNCQGTLKDDMDRPCSECRRTGFISSRNWTAKKNSEVKHIAAQVKRHVQACK